jgi:hypothetical protein
VQGIGYPPHALGGKLKVVAAGGAGGNTEGGFADAEDGVLAELPGLKGEIFLQIFVLKVEMKCPDIRRFLNYLFYNHDMGQIDIVPGQKLARADIGGGHFFTPVLAGTLFITRVISQFTGQRRTQRPQPVQAMSLKLMGKKPYLWHTFCLTRRHFSALGFSIGILV